MLIVSRLILLSILIFSSASGNAGIFSKQPSWPGLPLPPDAKLVVVMENGKVNGIPMQSYILTSWQPAEDTLQFYREEWAEPDSDFLKENDPGFKEVSMDSSHLISRVQDDFLITIQFDKTVTKTTKALVGISTLPTFKTRFVKLGRGVLLDPRSTVMSDIEATDDGRKSRTIVASREGGARYCASAYDTLYRKRGWERLTAEGADPNVLLFNKARSEVNIVCTEVDGKSMITLVQVEH